MSDTMVKTLDSMPRRHGSVALLLLVLTVCVQASPPPPMNEHKLTFQEDTMTILRNPERGMFKQREFTTSNCTSNSCFNTAQIAAYTASTTGCSCYDSTNFPGSTQYACCQSNGCQMDGCGACAKCGTVDNTGVVSDDPFCCQRLEHGALRGDMAANRTIVQRMYYLPSFKDTPLSDYFIHQILQKDLNMLRHYGMKTAIRFAYDTAYGTAAIRAAGGSDTNLTRVLHHISQLNATLRSNSDVISMVQAGFIGSWGEWHSSTHCLQTNNASRAIVDALMSVFPEWMQISIRYPRAAQDLYPSNDPRSARIGHVNDCFLASVNDQGTYGITGSAVCHNEDPTRYASECSAYSPDAQCCCWPSSLAPVENDKNVLAAAMATMPQKIMGGETCANNLQFVNCSYAMSQMKRMHWTYLNEAYHTAVVNGWKSEGCFPDIQRQLGYRLSLRNITLPMKMRRGAFYNISMVIYNSGWAAPVNPRPVQLLLKAVSGNWTLAMKLTGPGTDVRYWAPRVHTHIHTTIRIPHGAGGASSPLGDGHYRAFLQFPDAHASLRHRPEFAIRLANVGHGPHSTPWVVLPGVGGAHDLLSSIHVHDCPDGAMGPNATMPFTDAMPYAGVGTCGDGVCNGAETHGNCAMDCPMMPYNCSAHYNMPRCDPRPQGQADGNSCFGLHGYVEYIPGNIPFIISAPHGGDLIPQGWPIRVPNSMYPGVKTTKDAYTKEVAQYMADAVHAETGFRPHLIKCHLHRSVVDMNRDIGEADLGGYGAQLAWHEYHHFLEMAKERESRAPNGAPGQCRSSFYVDIHGQSHSEGWIEIGYDVPKADYALADNVLDTQIYRNKSSVRHLATISPHSFVDMLRGNHSLGAAFQWGPGRYSTVPSPMHPNANAGNYYSGGYSTTRHGATKSDTLTQDGLQLELPWVLRNPATGDKEAQRRMLASRLALGIRTFLNWHYPPSFAFPNVTRCRQWFANATLSPPHQNGTSPSPPPSSPPPPGSSTPPASTAPPSSPPPPGSSTPPASTAPPSSPPPAGSSTPLPSSPPPATTPPTSSPPPPAPSQLTWPISGTPMPDLPQSSGFGPRLHASAGYVYDFHRGIDIPTPLGTPVRALGDGTVRLAGNYSFYSDTVIQVTHVVNGTTLYATYLHMHNVTVAENQVVTRGQILGHSGLSVASQFQHLHFEIREGGLNQKHCVNPYKWLPYANAKHFTMSVLNETKYSDAVVMGQHDRRNNFVIRVVVDSTELDLQRVELKLLTSTPAAAWWSRFDFHEVNMNTSVASDLDQPWWHLPNNASVRVWPSPHNGQSTTSTYDFEFAGLSPRLMRGAVQISVATVDVRGHRQQSAWPLDVVPVFYDNFENDHEPFVSGMPRIDQPFRTGMGTMDAWGKFEEIVGNNTECYGVGSFVNTTMMSAHTGFKSLVVHSNAANTTKSNHVFANRMLPIVDQNAGSFRYEVWARIDPATAATGQSGPELSVQSTTMVSGVYVTNIAGIQYVSNPWMNHTWNIWVPHGPHGARWEPFMNFALTPGVWYHLSLEFDFTLKRYRRLRVWGPSGPHADIDISQRTIANEHRNWDSASLWITLEAQNLWQNCGPGSNQTAPRGAYQNRVYYDNVMFTRFRSAIVPALPPLVNPPTSPPPASTAPPSSPPPPGSSTPPASTAPPSSPPPPGSSTPPASTAPPSSPPPPGSSTPPASTAPPSSPPPPGSSTPPASTAPPSSPPPPGSSTPPASTAPPSSPPPPGSSTPPASTAPPSSPPPPGSSTPQPTTAMITNATTAATQATPTTAATAATTTVATTAATTVATTAATAAPTTVATTAATTVGTTAATAAPTTVATTAATTVATTVATTATTAATTAATLEPTTTVATTPATTVATTAPTTLATTLPTTAQTTLATTAATTLATTVVGIATVPTITPTPGRYSQAITVTVQGVSNSEVTVEGNATDAAHSDETTNVRQVRGVITGSSVTMTLDIAGTWVLTASSYETGKSRSEVTRAVFVILPGGTGVHCPGNMFGSQCATYCKAEETCRNVGSCVSSTGACSCQTNFFGANCEREVQPISQVEKAVSPTEAAEVSFTGSSSEDKLEISAGALLSSVTITAAEFPATAAPLPEVQNDATKPVMKSVATIKDFGPDGLKFEVPVAVTFSYDTSQVTNHDHVKITTFNVANQEWEEVGGTADAATGKCRGQLEHFSMYSVMEVTPALVSTNTNPSASPPTYKGGENTVFSLSGGLMAGVISGCVAFALAVAGFFVWSTRRQRAGQQGAFGIGDAANVARRTAGKVEGLDLAHGDIEHGAIAATMHMGVPNNFNGSPPLSYAEPWDRVQSHRSRRDDASSVSSRPPPPPLMRGPRGGRSTSPRHGSGPRGRPQPRRGSPSRDNTFVMSDLPPPPSNVRPPAPFRR